MDARVPRSRASRLRTVRPRAGARRPLAGWVSAAVLAAGGPLLGTAARADSQPAPPQSAVVTTAADATDSDDAAVSLREALNMVFPGGDGVRFDLPQSDAATPPVFRLGGVIPAGRAGVRVRLDDAGTGAATVLVAPTAAGPHRLNPNFTGAGTLAVDLGTGAAAELVLAGQNGHALTRVLSGTAVGATDTAFGKRLDLAAGAAARAGGNLYLGRLTGGGTLNLGDSLLTIGLFPETPGADDGAADGPGYSSAFAGSIAGSANAGLFKAGTGTLTLTGENTYGGGTVIAGGVLEVDSAAALGTGRVLLNGSTLRTLGVLNDRADGAAADATPAFLRQISLATGHGAIDLAGTEQLFAGPITGAGGLTVVGGGTLTLAGPNNHGGGTTVADATLVLASANALGLGDLGIQNATVRTAHTQGAVGFAGALAIGEGGATIETSGGDWIVGGGAAGGDLTKTGAGELRLLAPSSHASTTVTGGSLAVTGLAALGGGRLTLDGGTLFTPLADGRNARLANRVTLGAGGGTIETPTDLTLAGKLNGRGTLTKTGDGTLTLAGTNAAKGGVTVRDGALRASSAAALGTGVLTLDGGTFETAGGVRLGGDGTAGGFAVGEGGGTIAHDSANARTVVGGDVNLDGRLRLAGGGTVVFAPDRLRVGGGKTRVESGTTLELVTAVNSVDLAGRSALTGSGRVLGDVEAGGLVDPGGAGAGGGEPGVIDVDGDFRLERSGTLKIDVGSGGADFVRVGGAADLHGGTVEVNVAPGSAGERVAFAQAIAGGGASADLTVLTAGGGVTRGPSEVTVASWAFDAEVVDRQHTGASAEPLTVRLSRVSGGAEVFGENNVGAAADAVLALLPTATGASAELLAELAFADEHHGREALRGMTGAGSAGLSGVSFAGAGAVRRTTFNALRPGGAGGSTFRGQNPTFRGQNSDVGDEFGFGSFDLATADVPEAGGGVRTADFGDGDRDGGAEPASFVPGARPTGPNPLPWGGFAEGYFVFGGANGGAADVDFSTGGAVFGVDRLVSAGTRVGVLLGVGGAEADGGALDTDVTTWQVGLYGTRTVGRWHAAGAAVYGGESYETTRTVRVGSTALAADGETDGSTVTLAAETGYLLPIEWMDLRPLAGVQYVHSGRDGYTESGMGAANLAYGDASANSLRVQLGMRASKLLGNADGFAVVPELRGWWFGEVLGDDAPAPVRFAAAPTLPAFTTVGDEQVNQWVLGTGLTFLAGPRFRTYGHADALLGNDTAALALTGGAELRW